MSSETTLWSYLVVTFFAWVLMCCSLVLSEMTLWSLPGSHIPCIGTSFLHVLLAGVKWHYSCSCLGVTFPALVLFSFMYQLLVLRKITLWSCPMVTFPTRILLPFINWALVLIKYFKNSCIARWCWLSLPFEETSWSHSVIFNFVESAGILRLLLLDVW